MRKSLGLLVDSCVQKGILYTANFYSKGPVEKSFVLYTSCTRRVNTLISRCGLFSLSVKNKLSPFSTGPITITTIKLYKGVY